MLKTSAASAPEMEALGRRFGETLRSSESEGPGRVLVFLRGALGAGKTTLARGVLRAFGVAGIVRSPTYTLVESYETSGGCVSHVDLYRLLEAKEADFFGLAEYLESGVCLIEWPERGGRALPRADIEIAIDADGEPRRLSISACTDQGARLVKHLGRRLEISESI